MSLLYCSCMWSGLGMSDSDESHKVKIVRYDRVMDEYISLGSYSALHRMTTEYPQQTKVLIEDVLHIGNVFDPGIEHRLRVHFMDSVPQLLLEAVHEEFIDMSDVEQQLQEAVEKFQDEHPGAPTPHFYTQISCLGQGVVVSDTLVGISLDMYLGTNHPLYHNIFTESQRRLMTRDHIASDAIQAYIDYHHIQ